MGLKLGFQESDSLFPRGRDTGQGIGTKELAQFIDQHLAEQEQFIFISPSDFPVAALPSRNLVGYRDALNFDGTAQENAQGAIFILPEAWIDKQLKFTVWWVSQTAGAGNVYWRLYLQANRCVETLFTDQAWSTNAEMIDTKTTTNFVQSVSYQTSGKIFKKDAMVGIRIYRMADLVEDTLDAVDVDFLGLTIEVVD